MAITVLHRASPFSNYERATGESVGILRDGSTTTIAVPCATTVSGQGLVELYDGTTTKEIEASDKASGDHFGWSFAFGEMADGDVWCAVGAPDVSGGGQVYMFKRAAGVWSTTETAILTGGTGDFGMHLRIDGNRLVVGEPSSDDVYVFEVDIGGTDSWGQQGSTMSGTASDSFGFTVAIDDANDRVAIHGLDGGPNLQTYTWSGSAWSVEHDDILPGGNTFTTNSCDLIGDKMLVGVPATHHDEFNAGRIRPYTRSGSTWTAGTDIWSDRTEAAQQYFGVDIKMTGDLTVIVSSGGSGGFTEIWDTSEVFLEEVSEGDQVTPGVVCDASGAYICWGDRLFGTQEGRLSYGEVTFGTTHTGTGSAAASPYAGAATGVLTFLAAGATAASAAYAAASAGVEEFAATGSAASSAYACAGAGHQADISGSGAAAAVNYACTGSGGEEFAGTAVAAAASYACTATGGQEFAGTGSGAAAMYACAGTGGLEFSGTGAAATAQYACAGAGHQAGIHGTGSAASSPYACTATGQMVGVHGSGAGAASAYACTSSGAEEFTGTGAAAVSQFACTGIGVEEFTGTGSAAASAYACTGVGTNLDIILGSGSAAASQVACDGSGTQEFTGSAAAAATPYACTGAGIAQQTHTGTGSAGASPFQCTGSGVEEFTGTGAASSQTHAGASAGSLAYTGAGAGAASQYACAGAGGQEFTGACSTASVQYACTGAGLFTLDIIGSGAAASAIYNTAGVGTATLEFTPASQLRTVSVEAERRIIGVQSEQRTITVEYERRLIIA